ncbi:hypothetical protein EC973_002748 [Apophysomyces ossiformis]|uniref:Sas10 C-terminal domain-containing protein n=1 Tax=Apophysomyces ossiformis TaxID=679940 RepID=A0A8H7BQW2_9FUNG|nr:hypothetical protein EC973_002748 [Apophysomyces ossiformis]
MGKKRTPIFRASKASETQTRDEGKIKAIRTWDDIEHDSEDECEESEEEVYGLEGLESEEEESEDDDVMGEQNEEEEPEDKTWGRSKKAYYNADEGEDLDELREEEEEALKIQKERLAAMDEADFVDDTLQGWVQKGEQDEETDKQLIENVNKDLDDISFDVSKSAAKRRKNLPVNEKLKILQNESPELIDLLNEFKEKTQIISAMDTTVQKIRARGKLQEREAKFICFKYQLLMNYLTNISFYLALKASGTANIREHPVIQALVQLRGTLEKMETVEERLQPMIEKYIQALDAPEKEKQTNTIVKKKPVRAKKKVTIQEPVISEDEEEDAMSEREEEDITAQVDDIEQEFKSLKKQTKKRKRGLVDDFGELELLDEVDMEDKIAKKRSIRDYVAKIDAKQNKVRSKYQGDTDLPYRERNKQEKKGVPQPKDASADLDNADWDDEDSRIAAVMNGSAGDEEDDDYYEQIASQKSTKKALKKEEYEAERMPNVDMDYQVEDGEKRLASYQILKNRGLTPHRKKENRNARVKHRNKFAKKMKKLSSTRAVVKPLTGSYGGEATGIKSNIVKSVKF